MPLVEVEQNSVEWLEMRIGAVTASRVAAVMARLKNGGEAQVRQDYKAEVICERLTGRATEHFVSVPMEWGIENEPLAKSAYEVETGLDLVPGGLAMHPSIKWLMASPDGLLASNGLIECKCPNTATHLEYIIAGVVPAEYQWQMLCQMSCAERSFCDFVSFDPRLPKKLQLFVRRFERDDARIAAMESEVIKFLAEVDELIEKVKKCDMVDLDPSLTTRLQASIAAANSRGGKSK